MTEEPSRVVFRGKIEHGGGRGGRRAPRVFLGRLAKRMISRRCHYVEASPFCCVWALLDMGSCGNLGISLKANYDYDLKLCSARLVA